jgi:hypothetical protein
LIDPNYNNNLLSTFPRLMVKTTTTSTTTRVSAAAITTAGEIIEISQVLKMDYDSDHKNEDVEGNTTTGNRPSRPVPPSMQSQNISMIAQREPVIASFDDHFTLSVPSSLVRFRKKSNAARIFEDHDYQVVLEETHDVTSGNTHISVKRMTDTTAGGTFLRILYTVVCALWTGFFFVFCLSVLLFLVRNTFIHTIHSSIVFT